MLWSDPDLYLWDVLLAGVLKRNQLLQHVIWLLTLFQLPGMITGAACIDTLKGCHTFKHVSLKLHAMTNQRASFVPMLPAQKRMQSQSCTHVFIKQRIHVQEHVSLTVSGA